MIPFFHAVWGVRRTIEARRLSKPARAILAVLRSEWEMATADLRADAKDPRSRRVHARDGRTAGRDARRAQRSRLRAQEFCLHLDAGVLSRFPDALQRRVAREIGVPRDRAASSRGQA